MKNRLLLSFLFGAMSAGLMAQTVKDEVTITGDLTSKIKNADFSQGTPIASTVYTYDYNLPADDKGAGAGGTGLFGMQAVDGWTADYPSDNIRVMWTEGKDADGNAVERTDKANAKAAGLYAWADESAEVAGPGLGSVEYTAPYADSECTGNALAYVGVWGSSLSYTQEITLPAGDYLIEVKLNNKAGDGILSKNLIGFIADNGKEYLSSTSSYTVGTNFLYDYVVFRLTEETKGKLSLGYHGGGYGSGTAPHIFIDKIKLYSINKSYIDAKEIADARATLEALIEEGKDVDADVTESQKVLNNPNATIDELNEAIAKQKALNTAAQTDMSAYFLSNAHFTVDEPLPNGEGICTYNYDMDKNSVHYYGMLPVTDWTTSHPWNPNAAGTGDADQNVGRASGIFPVAGTAFLGSAGICPPATMSDGSTEGNLLGFVTCWSATMQYTQKVTLPAGKYTLVLSYYNSKGANSIAKNLIGFKEDNGTEHYATTTKFAEGKWLTEKVTFELTESTSGEFSMGYTAPNEGSGNQPHFFIDGISIYYVGEMSNPSLMILQAAISTANEAMEKKFNKDLKAQLQAAVDEAQKLANASSSDEDANMAAVDAINGVMSEVNKSIAAYEKLINFIDNDLYNAAEKYADATIYAELTGKLADLQDDLNEAYQSEEYTTEQIEEAIASLDAMIKEGVQKAWDAAIASGAQLEGDGIDISMFFDQLAYTYSTTAQSGANVPDKEWQYGDATNFKTQYGTAEVWNQSPFTVSRTITGLPAGTYTVTTKAFYRVADNVTNYDADKDSEGKAYIFVGNSKTELTNVADIASPTSPEGLGWAEVAASTTVYQPNSQQAAYNTFENADYTEALQKSAKSVIVSEKGDLTFGITADQMQDNAWVVWYTFSISYNAVDEEVLANELEALIEEAQDYLDTYQDDMNSLASDNLNNAVGEAAEVVDGEPEEMSAAMVALKEALENAKTNVAKLVALQDALDELEIALSDYSGTASKEALAEYDEVTGLANDTDDLTNEEIQAIIDRVYNAIALLKVPDGSSASDSHPTDFTQVIVNPDFESDVNKEGWTWNVENISGTGAKAEGINGTKSSEFWDNTPLDNYFKIAQTLSHLPAGTYKLSAWAVAAQVVEPTPSEDEEEVEIGYVALFATPAGGQLASTKVDIRENIGNPNGTNDDQKKWGTDADIIGSAKEYSVIFYVPEDDSDVEIGFQTVGVQTTKWFVCDDFTLEYYGKESNQTLTGDEGNLTDIEGIDTDASVPAAIYTIAGAKVSSLQKGINIVKYANGKVVKVLVK